MKFVVYLLLAACLVTAAPAGTYYVRTDGNNSNTGTANTSGGAWLTVQKALNTAVGGDTVLIQSGSYAEAAVSVRSGSSGNPIILRGQSLPTVASIVISHSWIEIRDLKINVASPALTGIGFDIAASDCIVDSVIFDNTVAAKPQCTMSQYDLGNTPVRITINNCQFLNADYFALALQGRYHTITNNYWSSPNGGDAVYLHSSNTLFKGNLMENWSRPEGSLQHTDLIQAFSNSGEISHDNIIERNVFKDCVGTQVGNIEDTGAQVRVTNWTWRNNIWSNVEAQMSMTAPDMYFYNNVFYRTGQNGGSVFLFRNNGALVGVANNGKVYNNIFMECGSDTANPGTGWYGFVGAVTGFEGDYNLVIGTGAGTVKSGFVTGGQESHSFNGVDPLFVNASIGDFRLQNGSPIAGMGYDWSTLFTDDFAGTTRSAPWDIGPYKYAGIVLSVQQPLWQKIKSRRLLAR